MFWKSYTKSFNRLIEPLRRCPYEDFGKTNAGFPKDFLEALQPETTEWPRYQKTWIYLKQLRNGFLEKPALLDIGSQFGFLTLSFLDLDYDVYATDEFRFYGQGIRPIRNILIKKGIRIEALPYEPYKLPFKTESMDVITLLAVIEHIPDSPRFLLKEIHRVLKVNGIIIVDTPNASALSKRIYYLLKGVPSVYFPIDMFYKSEIPFSGHHREYSPGELMYVMNRSEFRPIEIDYLCHGGDKSLGWKRKFCRRILPRIRKCWYPCIWATFKKN